MYLCGGIGKFEYSIIMCHEERFVWTVCSSAAKVFHDAVMV